MSVLVLCSPSFTLGRWISDRGLKVGVAGIDQLGQGIGCCIVSSRVCKFKNSPELTSVVSQSKNSLSSSAISFSDMASALSRTMSPSLLASWF